VQAIKYDEREVKVAKCSWDDHENSPVELVDAVWNVSQAGGGDRSGRV
jgi:hypothetical protein